MTVIASGLLPLNSNSSTNIGVDSFTVGGSVGSVSYTPAVINGQSTDVAVLSGESYIEVDASSIGAFLSDANGTLELFFRIPQQSRGEDLVILGSTQNTGGIYLKSDTNINFWDLKIVEPWADSDLNGYSSALSTAATLNLSSLSIPKFTYDTWYHMAINYDSVTGAVRYQPPATPTINGYGINILINGVNYGKITPATLNGGTQLGQLGAWGPNFQIFRLGSMLLSPIAETQVTYTVTVPGGTSGGFYLNGVQRFSPVLRRGTTYRFDQSDPSNSGHPLRFSIDNLTTFTGYGTEISLVGTAGSAGSYTQITVTGLHPTAMLYVCANHSGMGSAAVIQNSLSGQYFTNTQPIIFSNIRNVDAALYRGSIYKPPTLFPLLSNIPYPILSSSPSAITVTEPAPATFSVILTAVVPEDTNTIQYQWQKAENGSISFSNIINATFSTYTTPATTVSADNGDSYRVIVYDVAGFSIISPENGVNLAVTNTVDNPQITIITQPQNTTVNAPSPCSLSVFATITTGYPNPITYQWQKAESTSPNTFNNIIGATSQDYTTGSTLVANDNGDRYRVILSSIGVPSITSNVATLTVNAPTSAITITQQPANISASEGQNITVSVVAVSGGGGTLSYQWQFSSDGGFNWQNVPSGGTFNTYTISTSYALNGYKYRVLVNSSLGETQQISQSSTLTVYRSIIFVSQPTDQLAFENQSATFQVDVDTSSGSPTYTWQTSTDGINWVNAPLFSTGLGSAVTYAENYTVLNVSYATDNQKKYRCIISLSGALSSVISNVAVLTVKRLITPIIQPDNAQVFAGQSASFLASATVTSGNVTYQWQKAESTSPTVFTNILGATSPLYTTAEEESYWINRINNPSGSSESFNNIIINSTKEIYTSGTTNPGPAGNTDLLLFKFDRLGATLWQRSIGGVGIDDQSGGGGIAIDLLNSVYIAGRTASSGGAGGYDTFIAKYDRDGGLQWQRSLGGPSNETIGSIVVDNFFNVYAVGTSDSSGGSGFSDIILYKLNSFGAIQWQKSYGSSTGDEYGNGIVLDSSQNIYITGKTVVGAVSKIVIIKASNNGVIEWQRTLDASSVDDSGSGVVVDVNGSVYVCGNTGTSGVVVRYSSIGTVDWQKTISSVVLNEISITSLTSSTPSILVTGTITSTTQDIFAIRMSSVTGDVSWQRKIGGVIGSPNENGYGIAVDEYSYYISGSSSVNSGDALLIKLPANGSEPGTYANTFEYSNTSQSVTTSNLISLISTFFEVTRSLNANTRALSSSTTALGRTTNLVTLPLPIYVPASLSVINDNEDLFRVIISAVGGDSYTSRSAKLLVTPVTIFISIENQPVNTSVNDGSAAQFVIAASTNSGTPVAYQWQKAESTSPSTFTNITTVGANLSTYTTGLTVFSDDNQDRYRCGITAVGANPVNSNSATLTVVPLSVIITTQPVSQTINEGSGVTFNVIAFSTTGSSLSYQWQRAEPGTSVFQDITSAVLSSYTLISTSTPNDSGARYRCLISSPGVTSVTSNSATLTVTRVLSYNNLDANTFILEQSTGTIRVSAFITGGTIQYQWQKAENGSSAFNNIAGQTSDELIIGPVFISADNGDRYRVIISSSGLASITTNATTISVLSLTTPRGCYYSKQIGKTGAAIGTIISIVKPGTYPTAEPSNSDENNWNINSRYPGFLECNGSSLNPNQYLELYKALGTKYGGTAPAPDSAQGFVSYPNITGTFNLPNLRSRKLMGTGSVDGNRSSSPSLAPSSGSGPGALGGVYTLNTIRQLPPAPTGSPISSEGIAVDTFELGTFRTSGFTTCEAEINTNFVGNISFNLGPLGEASTGSPLHEHIMVKAERGSLNLPTAADGCGASTGPCTANVSLTYYQNYSGTVLPWTIGRYINQANPEEGEILTHSHYLRLDSTSGGSGGNQNGVGNVRGSGQDLGSALVLDSKCGVNVNRTIPVTESGADLNVGQLVMSEISRSEWDSRLRVRLDAAETLSMMQPYFRTKYIIKAF